MLTCNKWSLSTAQDNNLDTCAAVDMIVQCTLSIRHRTSLFYYLHYQEKIKLIPWTWINSYTHHLSTMNEFILVIMIEFCWQTRGTNGFTKDNQPTLCEFNRKINTFSIVLYTRLNDFLSQLIWNVCASHFGIHEFGCINSPICVYLGSSINSSKMSISTALNSTKNPFDKTAYHHKTYVIRWINI